uniref:Solute carrier family 39 member 5 n=1 Tax=Phasianus colchicus TaxID=9054 RepID=A0A669QRC0_PHACC
RGLRPWGVLGWGCVCPAGGRPGPPTLSPYAAQEHGYYLQQLFGLYGANGTLPSAGLARLLGSLGLGRVQVPPRPPGGAGGAAPASPPGLGARQRGGCQGPPPQVPPRDPPPGLGWGLRSPHGAPPALSIPPPQCLNVTQLLLNFGLDAASQLTPQQFTLLCPALLYQIDSRVCIHHPLGWALLAVTFISVPSAAAVAVVPLLSLGQLHALLSFLVALAVGTLCGDALLHLWPHVGTPVAAGRSRCAHRLCSPPSPVPTERPPRRPRGSRPRCEAVRPPQPPPAPPAPTPSRAVRPSPPAGAELRCLTAPEVEAEPKGPPGPHHGHSHGPALPPSPAAADLAWMVVLGDGIHNLTDGLAIGVAFSHSLPSGLSTALAVLCHELPHELGDLAVLLQAGTAPRTLLLLNLLSALLSCLGAAVGAAVGQNAAHLTPWILTATAGTFLYVALADMVRAGRAGGRGPCCAPPEPPLCPSSPRCCGVPAGGRGSICKLHIKTAPLVVGRGAERSAGGQRLRCAWNQRWEEGAAAPTGQCPHVSPRPTAQRHPPTHPPNRSTCCRDGRTHTGQWGAPPVPMGQQWGPERSCRRPVITRGSENSAERTQLRALRFQPPC